MGIKINLYQIRERITMINPMILNGAARYAAAYKLAGFGSMALGGPVIFIAGAGAGFLANKIYKNIKERKSEDSKN